MTFPSPQPPMPPHGAAAPRFDLYSTIHKALRGFMQDTLQRLGALDVHDAQDLDDALAQLDVLLRVLRSHLRHENDFVHTAIEARQPAGAAAIADDHLSHQESIQALQAEARSLREAPAAGRAPVALRLYRHLALFVAENLEHMHAEETRHNALLWAHYSDAELVALHDRLLRAVAPADLAECLRWMARALPPQELAAVLGDMQRKAPPEPFRQLLGMVRGELDAPRWHKLASALALPQAAEPLATH